MTPTSLLPKTTGVGLAQVSLRAGGVGPVSFTSSDAETLERCIAVGGVALFPADTVYGLACEPDTVDAVARLYALKGRRPDKPAAVMFFQLDLALAALPELGDWTRAALESLLPGGITALVPNPQRRYPLACGPEPETLGLRVPALSPGPRTRGSTEASVPATFSARRPA